MWFTIFELGISIMSIHITFISSIAFTFLGKSNISFIVIWTIEYETHRYNTITYKSLKTNFRSILYSNLFKKVFDAADDKIVFRKWTLGWSYVFQAAAPSPTFYQNTKSLVHYSLKWLLHLNRISLIKTFLDTLFIRQDR